MILDVSSIYQSNTQKSKVYFFIILVITLISFGYYSKDFRLDASSETLLSQNDISFN